MEGWRSLQLTECIQRAPTPAKIPRRDFKVDGDFPIVSQEKDLINGYWSDESALICVESPLVVFGDHTQILKYVDFDFVVGADGVKLLLPNSFLSAKFLYYFLMANPITGLGYARHYRLLKELTVRFPEHIPEQQRIVAILDEAFVAIATATANAEQNLANARELFESELNRVFSDKEDEWIAVEQACFSIIDCVNKTAPQVAEATPFRMIRTTNVRNGMISLDKVRYVSEDTYQKWTRRQIPQVGDVILTREAPMGEVGILGDAEGIFLGQRLVAYRVDLTKITPDYLCYALRSRLLQQQMRAFGSGSTVQHMRVPDTKRLLIPLPSLAAQRETVKTVSGVERLAGRLIGTQNSKLTALAELKQSILHKAFTGQLTAADANIPASSGAGSRSEMQAI